MKVKTKKRLSILLIIFLVSGVISLVIFYNLKRFDARRERLEARRNRYVMRHAEGSEQVQKLRKEKYEKSFHEFKSKFIIWQLVFPLFSFAVILGVYFLIRNKNNNVNALSRKKILIGHCKNCGNEIEKNWNACPFCGHKYKK